MEPREEANEKPLAVEDDEPKAAEADEPIRPLDERSGSFIALVMLALSLAVFLAALDTSIIATALPIIAGHFDSSSGYVWIGSAYVLAAAAATPIFGKVADIFGTKPTLLLANLLFFIGSLIAALSINVGMIIAARAIQGIGGGGLLTLVDTIISDWVSLKKRPIYLSAVGATWAVACALGPIIGGAFAQKVSWRWCFYINLPLDGISFFILLFFLDVKTPKTPILQGLAAIDCLGTITVTGATLIFLFGLEYGGVTYPWNSATVICLLVFGVVLGILFVLVEWKLARYPLMPLRLFNNPSNTAIFVGTLFHGLILMGDFYYLPLYFQAVLGATPILSGVYLLPSCIAIGLSAIVCGAYVGMTGKYKLPIIISWVAMVLGFGLFIDLDATHNWAKIIIFQILAGAGIGPFFQAPLVAVQAQSSPGDVSVACAALNFIRQIATAISIVLGQVVFSNQLEKERPSLVAHLGPERASQLGGADISANVPAVDRLAPALRTFLHQTLAKALRPMWIMYACFAAVGFISCFFISNQTLSADHQVRELGLEAEALHAEEQKTRRKEKRARKVAAEMGEKDEKGSGEVVDAEAATEA